MRQSTRAPTRARALEGYADPATSTWRSAYPNVHRYTPAQRQEITRHVYCHLFARREPLFQGQDHLVIYQGVRDAASSAFGLI